MKIVFDAVTPAQINFQKNIIKELKKKGHDIYLTIRPRNTTIKLADLLGIEYVIVGYHKKKFINKIIYSLPTIYRLAGHIHKFNPDLCFGSAYVAPAGALVGKKTIHCGIITQTLLRV